jgi:purine-binding chemotaxis protein CheW
MAWSASSTAHCGKTAGSAAVSVYVRLRLASEAYAMPVEHVLEVAELGDVVPVPGSRPEVLGVRNLRGQILAVVDLALLLGIPRSAPPDRLLVAEAWGITAGFAIDEVSMVGELADPAEEAESDLLVGATHTGDDLVGVIDVRRVFASFDRHGSELPGTG